MKWLSLIQCPACSGSISHNGDAAFRCSGCSAHYPAAGSVPDFIRRHGDGDNPIEVDYDYHLRRRHGSLRRLYNRLCRTLELQLIKREAERVGRSLDMVDVGCGDPTRPGSTYHAQLFPLARVYLGVEPSLPLACRVQPLPSIGLVRANGEIRVLKEGVMDMALSFRALDRCLDPNAALANMMAALRPEGRILITLVNKDIWYRAVSEQWWALWGRRPSYREERRCSEMSPLDLSRRLESVGFRDVELYDSIYFSGLLQSKSLDWIVQLLGEKRCDAALRRLDAAGGFLAPGRGGMFVAVARKPTA